MKNELTPLSGVKHLQELPDPKPVINQVELHPWCQQRDIVKYCQEHDIAVQAYSPLVQADKSRLGDKTLTTIAAKHGKEPAQVLIRWSLQKGSVDTKSGSPVGGTDMVQVHPPTQERDTLADQVKQRGIRLRAGQVGYGYSGLA